VANKVLLQELAAKQTYGYFIEARLYYGLNYFITGGMHIKFKFFQGRSIQRA